MQIIHFRTATVELDGDFIVSIFNDNKENHFYIEGKDEEYLDIARMYGYADDWRRYALEHELAHHFIADNMGWKWSWSLHSGAGRRAEDFKGTWPDHIGWEERIVNQFQLYCQTGERDPLNVLHLALRQDLDELACDFCTLMGIIKQGYRHINYNHNTREIGTANLEYYTNENYEPKANVLHPA